MKELFVVPACDVSIHVSYEVSVSLHHMLIAARPNVLLGIIYFHQLGKMDAKLLPPNS